MIMGASHLIYSSHDPQRHLQHCLDAGYVEIFREARLLNHQSKKKFLSNYTPKHEIIYLEHPQQVSVELIRHGASSDKSSTPWLLAEGKVVLSSSDVVAEKEFFTSALSFKNESEALKLSAPFPRWSCLLELRSSAQKLKCKLDSEGYTCLSFISTDMSADLKKVSQAGAQDILEPFEVSVNQKKLLVSLFRTPSNAICEFIHIARK